MKNNQPNIDGFVLRRRQQTADASGLRPKVDPAKSTVPAQFLTDPAKPKTTPNIIQRPNGTGTLALPTPKRQKLEFDLSLDDEPKKSSGKQPKARKKRDWRKITKRGLIVLGILLVLGGAYFGWRLFANASNVFSGNVFNAVFSNKPLKTDQYGRTNMVLFGTSEDDPGHGGAMLTDSIMIISFDQKKKDAFLVSVPRDLWVKYGRACNSGYEGKVNEVFSCNSDEGKDKAEKEANGAAALRTKVGEVFGIDLQYSVHINYGVVRGAVDAVGGVDITIESSDPRGILDRNFDWRCNYKCHLVKWPNGPAHLNGEQALFLAQARNEAGGYGLPRGNFDREENQRKIMIALKDKATSAGFLGNPLAVTGLLDSLGSNVRTNIDAEEIKSLIELAKTMDTNNIRSLSLVDEENQLVTTGMVGASSVVRPVAGVYDYSALQAFMLANLKGNGALMQEKAVVDVLNGSGTPGVAQTQADKIEAEGIKIGKVANAPQGDYGKATLYDLSGGKKPATIKKLEELYGVTVAKETTVPAGVNSQADIVIIFGAQSAPQ